MRNECRLESDVALVAFNPSTPILVRTPRVLQANWQTPLRILVCVRTERLHLRSN
jgi:hypothetical protein